jgi:NAD(P)-dependent dehydrogenase (short-subunit alcohol dehydrogenase family)
MSDSITTITASETPAPGRPVRPANLGMVGKIRWNVRHPPADPTNVSFAGKTVLVVGANTGVGFEAAVKYAAQGAERLILGVRTREKGEDTKARILARVSHHDTTDSSTKPKRDPNSISYLLVDLCAFASVQKFAVALEKEVFPEGGSGVGSGLDVALLNAGVSTTVYSLSPDGWDMSVQVNTLSTSLLAILILPMLRRSAVANPSRAPTHLTFVSSYGTEMIKRSSLEKHDSPLEMVNDPKGWFGFTAYTVNKLMGMIMMRHLAEEVTREGGGVVVNATCPGMCKTDLGRDIPRPVRAVLGAAFSLVQRSAEEGGRSLVSATALGPESHGRFWHNDVLYP